MQESDKEANTYRDKREGHFVSNANTEQVNLEQLGNLSMEHSQVNQRNKDFKIYTWTFINQSSKPNAT